MAADWEVELAELAHEAFLAYCAEHGRDPEDPEAVLFWEAYCDDRIDRLADGDA